MVQRTKYSLLLMIIILSLFFTPIMTSEGIFEIHIKNYFLQKSLELEKCCPQAETESANCASHCNIFMEICLSIYQKVPHRYACDIGENMIVTDILGNDKMFTNGDRDYTIKVRERWIKNFNIFVKIKHRNEKTKKEDLIVTLSSAEENVKPSSDWITKHLSTPKDHFQLFVSFRYSCSEYHYGEMCDKYCKPNDSGMGHYNCSSAGDIICHNGYIGSYCDKVVCQKKCIHGTCTGPNLCRCFTGWTGDSCERCIPYPGCVNGGCRQDEKNREQLPLTCDCKNGWGGMFCNIDLNYCSNNLNVCLNNGECQNFGDINTNQQYRCICKPGFRGTHCEKPVANCVVRACQNGGHCQKDDQRKRWTCICNAPFYGDQCQFNMTSCAETPCIGSSSKCHVDPTIGFRCDCASGFIGRNCEIDKDECSTNPCLNGGMCIDRASGFRCVCPVGFSGNRCQVNKNDCQRLSCMNGAKCMDRANRIDCECTVGWTGPICNQNIDECAINQPCMHNGKCHDTPGSYQCECAPSWSGVHCQMKVLPNNSAISHRKCLINPCRNNGICYLTKTNESSSKKDVVKSIGGPYHCSCPPGFTGPLCNYVMIANGSVIDTNVLQQSTGTLVTFTENSSKSPMTLINLIIISIGVPSILLILIVISTILCKTSKSLRKSHSAKYHNNSIKNLHSENNSNIKIFNNKLIYNNSHSFNDTKIPLAHTKRNNCLNNIPHMPHLSLTTYKCSMKPLVVDNISALKNPNLFSVDITEEDNQFVKKSLQSVNDRDVEPESIIYQNINPTNELLKSKYKSNSSTESYANVKNEEHLYNTLRGSNSVMLKRKKDRKVIHGLCSSQNSLLDSPNNHNIRTAVSQQFHQPTLHCHDDRYFERGEPDALLKVHQKQSHNPNNELTKPIVNYKRSHEAPVHTTNERQFSDNKYVVYYHRSQIPPKINYNLISHPNFREISCFRDSSIIYPSLGSIKTDSTSIDGNASPKV